MSEPAKPGIEFYGGYQVYSESGVDLTLLSENLKRSIEERIDSNCRTVALFESLRGGCAGTGRRQTVFDAAALVRHLSDHRVEYVLIGGLAMMVHGSSYQTKDLDICYSRTEANIATIATAFAPLHPYLRGAPAGLPFRFDTATIRAGLNFTLVTDLGDVDLLGEVAGVGQYMQALAQSEDKEMYGVCVRVLSLDGLIAAKQAAGRTKDRLHLLELEELKKHRDSAP